ncbi:DUF418 domain-containing protein [Qipengyuania gelatinilytica]|uniref:DUF418 domain-containing protein n=1 Tax=Qipengyuania gelatinilytica TaxID=2867231 RepID=A0ABX9A616_9SPHN|nr:DUF418 domain-containing protein [Qipengyuania gelatinilytica]
MGEGDDAGHSPLVSDTTPDMIQPIAESGERIESLDFVRGVAVLGILVANIIAMGQPFEAAFFPGAFTLTPTDLDMQLWVGQFVLIDGKMRGLFSLLFGAGLYLFLEKSWESGRTLGLQARRLFWLGCFGLIHYYFIWAGDILFLYAVCGFGVIALSGLSAKLQLAFGVIGYLTGAMFFALVNFITMRAIANDGTLEGMGGAFMEAAEYGLYDAQVETAIRQHGTYLDFVAHTFEVHATEPFASLLDGAMEALPLMAIGMALYRFGLFEGRMNGRRLLAASWTGFLVGGAALLWIALDTLEGGIGYYEGLAASTGWAPLPRLVMMLGMLGLLVSYAPQASGRIGQSIKAAGRTAFTNYLGASIVMLFVFGNWGLDLFGELSRTSLYGVVALAWIVMLLWSRLWLEHYRYGPLEWLWRCLTYGRVFQLRR